jgi:hypothetical protein
VFRGQRRATSSRQGRGTRTVFITALSVVAVTAMVLTLGSAPAMANNTPRQARIPGFSHPANRVGAHSACQSGVSNCPVANRLWSGYVVTPSTTTFTSVSANWVQPKVTCPKKSSPNADAWSLFWVGLDGSTTTTVEQGGSEAQCMSGKPHYTAWWEMYPTNSIQPSFSIAAGDHISASVVWSSTNDTYTVTVNDTTAGHEHSLVVVASTDSAAVNPDTYTTTEDGETSGPTTFPPATPDGPPGTLCAGDSCDNASAEWIVEAPGDAGGNKGDLYPLAPFQPIAFKAANATDSAGHEGSVYDPYWQYTGLNLVNSSNQVLANVESLKNGGQRFRDIFDRV